jgi:hypothetical protein
MCAFDATTGTRIAFRTLKCGNSPRSNIRQTVAAHTPRIQQDSCSSLHGLAQNCTFLHKLPQTFGKAFASGIRELGCQISVGSANKHGLGALLPGQWHSTKASNSPEKALGLSA